MDLFFNCPYGLKTIQMTNTIPHELFLKHTTFNFEPKMSLDDIIAWLGGCYGVIIKIHHKKLMNKLGFYATITYSDGSTEFTQQVIDCMDDATTTKIKAIEKSLKIINELFAD